MNLIVDTSRSKVVQTERSTKKKSIFFIWTAEVQPNFAKQSSANRTPYLTG